MLGLLLLVGGAASRAVMSASCSLSVDGRAPEVDVLILGAGITGVTAARTLEVSGIPDFLVLEAGDRIGGRIREDDGAGLELGANWIHGLDMRDQGAPPYLERVDSLRRRWSRWQCHSL